MFKKIFFLSILFTLIFLTLGIVGFIYSNKKFNDTIIDKKINEQLVETSNNADKSDGIEFEITEKNSDNIFNTTFKNDIYYYNQNDYGSSAYGTFGTIKGYGCGPTAMAIIISSFTKKEITPIETTKYACDNGYCTQDGTNSKFFSRIAKEYKLIVEGPLNTSNIENQNKVLEKLEEGQSLVIMSVSDGYFYKGGHYIVLSKSKNGNIQVLDPNSIEKSITYTFDFLMDKEKTNPQYFYIVSEEGE